MEWRRKKKTNIYLRFIFERTKSPRFTAAACTALLRQFYRGVNYILPISAIFGESSATIELRFVFVRRLVLFDITGHFGWKILKVCINYS